MKFDSDTYHCSQFSRKGVLLIKRDLTSFKKTIGDLMRVKLKTSVENYLKMWLNMKMVK